MQQAAVEEETLLLPVEAGVLAAGAGQILAAR